MAWALNGITEAAIDWILFELEAAMDKKDAELLTQCAEELDSLFESVPPPPACARCGRPQYLDHRCEDGNKAVRRKAGRRSRVRHVR